MAKISVEDCIDKTSSLFELVALAAYRSGEISSGSKPLIDREHRNEKPTVSSLREIGDNFISIEKLREKVIIANCRYAPIEATIEPIENKIEKKESK